MYVFCKSDNTQLAYWHTPSQELRATVTSSNSLLMNGILMHDRAVDRSQAIVPIAACDSQSHDISTLLKHATEYLSRKNAMFCCQVKNSMELDVVNESFAKSTTAVLNKLKQKVIEKNI